MSNMVWNTPFSEYREEQSSINIFDYFVTPNFFEQFCDKKPILVYGSRGSGKTTIMKALSISETKNVKDYLEKNNYLGIYYRIDLNVTTSFGGDFLTEERWKKLFSHYFILALSYELIKQAISIKKEINIRDESALCAKISVLFCIEYKVINLEELKTYIYKQLHIVRDFLNNCSEEQMPHICDYSEIIKELPEAIINSIGDEEKTVFYLIDEFEGLSTWQQQIVLSFAKYSDSKHTFKICMRPDGLKSSDTIGGEYISETDDVRSIDLTEKITSNKNEFYNYALQVCQKRIELFYKKHNIPLPSDFKFEDFFEEISVDDELSFIFEVEKHELKKEIREYLNNNHNIKKELQEELYKHFISRPLDFYIFKIICFKQKGSFESKIEHILATDAVYSSTMGNYKNAILYYLCLTKSINKTYAGFKIMVNISGGTVRYLLEICNEVFEAALNNGFSYEDPIKISARVQTNAIIDISNKRVRQVSAIPEIGPNIRLFIISLGRIFQVFHKDERISKIEPNHFSFKADKGDSNTNLQLFLKECVIRGVLIKSKNNKRKKVDGIVRDEYIYILHPIYTPAFSISWRRKQKAEFNASDLEILINNDTKKITELIRTFSKNTQENEESQLELDIL